MPVRKNGYYADPALGTAFDNLASAFATPGGADVAGYANASATREKALRLQDLYNYASDPNYDPTIADRRGIAVGNLTGTNSVGAQNQNDATARRGQDVTAASATNVANINNAGALARTYAAPVIVSDGQNAFLPAQTQAATGLPGMFRGNVTTKPGETVTLPDNSVIAGAPKPPTETEIKAAAFGRLPASTQAAVVSAPAGVSAIVGKDGSPTNVFTADSVGQQPYEKDTRQPQIANFKAPDGRVGTAVLDKDTGKWKETQTGAELPAGTQTYTANLQGDKGATGLGTSTQNNIDQQLVDLALTESTSKQLRNIVTKNPAVQGLAGHIRGTVQDMVQAGGEVGQLFNVNIKKMQDDIAAGRVDPEVAKRFSNFDPNIPATAMLETLLTAQVAKVLDPNGRISNDRYEQVAKALGSGGLMGNTAKTIATLDQLDKVMADRRGILAPVRPAAAAIGQTPAASATPGATPAIRTYNPATGALE